MANASISSMKPATTTAGTTSGSAATSSITTSTGTSATNASTGSNYSTLPATSVDVLASGTSSMESTTGSSAGNGTTNVIHPPIHSNKGRSSSLGIDDEHETDDMPPFDAQSMSNFEGAMSEFTGFQDNMNMFSASGNNGMGGSNSSLQPTTPPSPQSAGGPSKLNPEMMVII